MSWRFRKIFSIGPFRWAASKGGFGANWGIPGFRIGVSPNGRKYISICVPGTGLYFIKYLTEDSVNSSPQKTINQTKSTIQPVPKEPWWK